jgi:Zn-dependent peptidase ImmA (M78 family)/transcriptional regulator with XRE-family HTH domain
MNVNVNGEMLILARDFRQMTQKELTAQTGISQSTIAKVEGGLQSTLSAEHLAKIVEKLQFPSAFFEQKEELLSFGSSSYFYRKRTQITAQDRKEIHSVVNMARIAIKKFMGLIDVVATRTMPRFDLDEFGNDPKRIAQAVRGAWTLPDGPVRNLTGIMESAGILIVPCDFRSRAFDATSLRLGGYPPMVFINDNLPGDRWRFTLAHELAHLVMHEVPSDTMEKEADAFAAELLCPEAQIRPHLARLNRWTIAELAPIKQFWQVSLHSLIYRGKELNIISAEFARALYIRYAPIRQKEPLPLTRENQASFSKIVSAIRDSLGYGDAGVAKLVNWPEDVTRQLLSLGEASQPSRLRLVQ